MGKVVASYLIKVVVREADGIDKAEIPTIREVNEAVADAFEDFLAIDKEDVSVNAERTDR